MNTNYGIKKEGRSRFIIVAPHAAGYDINTEYLAPRIAKRLKAFLVVNRKYHKRRRKDFNKLSLNRNKQYIWGTGPKDKCMKEFYDDIVNYAQSIYEDYSNKPIIIFIHGMSHGKDEIDIDIGSGVANNKGQLLGTIRTKKYPRHPEAGSNTGVFRSNRKDVNNLRDNLISCGLKVGIGEARRRGLEKRSFAAWSRENGIQYFSRKFIKIPLIKIPPAKSFQLEITRRLREKENLMETSKAIADAIESVYS